MTIMPFEGVTYPAATDEVEFIIHPEPTHSEDDEAFYVSSILSGEYDEAEADAEGFYSTDEDYSESDSRYFADAAQDRWERSFWGD